MNSVAAADANVVLPAGTYDIFIIVDTREVAQRKERSVIQQQLELRGLNVLTKNLAVGDFLWVARPRRIPDGCIELEDVVLDYIVERKTTDDLVASIKDSRFKDQKVRLGGCGLPNVIYLVEKSRKMTQAVNFGLAALRTAIISTQVINGFFLRETESLAETVDYLVCITKEIESQLKHQDITYNPNEKGSRREQGGLQISRKSFKNYQSVNNKSKERKLQEIWTRQLMTIKGLSGEKAVVIVRTFPTMRSLLRKLAACSTDTERDNVIRMSGGNGRKAIGTALARKIRLSLCGTAS
ncbi:restriction endonuclease type II-like protein [Phlyctochytrium arcticum]|nr:restriction endonuclease type II-like protein [Phlyctochytrium arcticum]